MKNYYKLAITKNKKLLKRQEENYYLVITYKNLKPTITSFTKYEKATAFYDQQL